MKQMMEMSKLNENHKLLADMNGSWNFSHQNVDEPRPERQAAGIQRHRHSKERHGRPLR